MKDKRDNYAHLCATDCMTEMQVFTRALRENKALVNTQLLWINNCPEGWEAYFQQAQTTATVVMADNMQHWSWERANDTLAHMLRAYLVEVPEKEKPSIVTCYHDDDVPPCTEQFRKWLRNWVRHEDTSHIHFSHLNCWGDWNTVRVDIRDITLDQTPAKPGEIPGESPHAHIFRWHDGLTWEKALDGRAVYRDNFFLWDDKGEHAPSTLCPWPNRHYHWVSAASREIKRKSRSYMGHGGRPPMDTESGAWCMHYDPELTIEQWADITNDVMNGKYREGVFWQEL